MPRSLSPPSPIEIEYQRLLHPAKLTGPEAMGKRLESDQADQFLVAEVIELIDGGNQRFGFRDVLDGDGLRRIQSDGWLTGCRCGPDE